MDVEFSTGSPAPPGNADSLNSAGVYRLMAVDEDPAVLDLLTRATHEFGYEIHTTTDFAEASDYIAREHPDVLLLGIETAQPQLLEMVDLIKRNPALKDTALMVLSGDGSEKVKIKTLWRGADEYIQKPINLAEFAIRLSNLCELRRYRRVLAEQNAKLENDKKRMARYFSDDLVDRILANDPALLEGANVRASLLFFDLRNSTGIGESLEPKQFSEFLTNVFTDIMDLIYGNLGSVNKMMGDGIMATFGCPVSAGDDTLNCVRCALSIREYLNTYNEVRPDYLSEPLRAGMGISTGRVFAGNVGSVRHIEYAVLGDPVNVASRLESLTRRVPVDILIDGETRDWMGTRIGVRRVRKNRLRGKQQQTRIYSLDMLHTDEARIGPAYGPTPEDSNANIPEGGANAAEGAAKQAEE